MRLELLSKSYDLRGIAGSELTEADYEALGNAFARLIPGTRFVVGRDARITSETFARAFARGVTAQGKDVSDLGLCSTDMLQFATVRYPEIDAGFMVTASHNPKEYNGIKSCLRDAVPINLKEWAPRLAEAVRHPIPDAPVAGTVEPLDVVADWTEHVASFAKGDFSGLKVVADAGNGVAGAFMDAVADRLGFELVPMYFDPDGDFPNHHPSPIESKNTADLRKKVVDVGADVGVAFDGDADRAVVIDETGKEVSGSAVCCAIVEATLAENPGATIVSNAVSSEYVGEFTESLGGKHVRSKVGHVYIKEMMRDDPSIAFAWEHSGHYYFRKNANADSGVIAFVHFLSAMAARKAKASEIRARYEKYPSIEETNFRVSDVASAIEKIRRAYEGVEPEFFDGMTLKSSDFRLNVRPSSNEPLLRLNLEAKDSDVLERELAKVTGILKKLS